MGSLRRPSLVHALAYHPIAGYPLILWPGIVLLPATAAPGGRNRRGSHRISLRWHFRPAWITLIPPGSTAGPASRSIFCSGAGDPCGRGGPAGMTEFMLFSPVTIIQRTGEHMTRLSWELKLVIVLVLISVSIYTIKFLVLGNPENTYYYLLNALGFLPINVLLVTIVLNKLLSVRSKRDKLEKLNMVIGTFFSEVGTGLLTVLSSHDPDAPAICNDLIVTADWSEDDFSRVSRRLRTHPCSIDVTHVDLDALKRFLAAKRTFLLRLLENPVLLEHESFTELLRAVFHLAEELERRETLDGLPATDTAHLAGDLTRVYGLLVLQWVDYMQYLKNNYPYMFSLAIRTNPFDATASAVVR
jgi:hypothetical protein